MKYLKSVSFDHEYSSKTITDICLQAYYLRGVPHAEVRLETSVSDNGKLFAIEVTVLAENGNVIDSFRKEYSGEDVGLQPSRLRREE